MNTTHPSSDTKSDMIVENNPISGQHDPLPGKFPQLINFSKDVEVNFQQQFTELEDYLVQELEEQNYDYSPGTQQEEKISMAKAKAKEYVKNCARETFRHLKGAFEETQLHHILPSCFFTQVIEDIKSELDEGLHQLTGQIFESISNPEKCSLDQKGQKSQKRSKKGKSKIPKKALLILKNWLTEHFQDPYPTHAEKMKLASEAGVSFKQVQNWFTNARGRIWRRTYIPEKFVSQVEEKLKETTSKSEPKIPPVQFQPCLGEAIPIQAAPAGFLFSQQLK